MASALVPSSRFLHEILPCLPFSSQDAFGQYLLSCCNYSVIKREGSQLFSLLFIKHSLNTFYVQKCFAYLLCMRAEHMSGAYGGQKRA